MSPFWQRWLRIASIALVIYGVFTAFAVFPALTGPTHSTIELLFWPRLEQTGALGPHAVFLLGVLGAVVMGWAVLMYFVVAEAVSSGAPWAFRALWASLITWFVVDNLASWVAGAPLNLLPNTLVAAVFVAPLVFGRRVQTAARRHA